MACDDCERNRQIGHKFCTKCGASLQIAYEPQPAINENIEMLAPAQTYEMPAGCPDCGTNRLLGRNFCTTCGAQLVDDAPQYRDFIEPPKNGAGWAIPVPSMIAIAIAVIFSLVCMFMYIGDVWRFVYDVKVSIYVFFVVEIDLGTITGLTAQLFWVFIAVVLMSSSILVFWFSKGAFSGFRSPGYKERLEKTPLYNLGLLFGSTLVIEIAIIIILQGLGINTDTPEILSKMTPVENAFYMARAAVWEEIAFRLVPIGVPMAIIAMAMRRKDCLKQILGGSGMSRIAVVLLIVSSVVFAYAHVEGWGLWKMFTIMISAFVMGYLFVRFGIFVSIVFHFITDYTTLWMIVDNSFGSLLIVVLVGLGVICIPLMVKKAVEGIGALKNAPNIAFDQDSIDSKRD